MFLLRLYTLSSCSDMSWRSGCIIIFAWTKLAAAASIGRIITVQWLAPLGDHVFGLLADVADPEEAEPVVRSLVAC